jgi:P2 family phage contractile tail tube protein
MRHILHGFTMYIDGDDYGYDTETVTLPSPTPATQEYQGGGMDLKVAQPMAALDALEATVKMAGQNPDIMKRMAKGPGQTSRITFRGAVLDQPTGSYVTHIAIVEGCPNFGSRDEWQRGEKAGLEFTVNGITYYRYEAGSDVVHEVQAWPPKRVVNGIDQLAAINAALGY